MVGFCLPFLLLAVSLGAGKTLQATVDGTGIACSLTAPCALAEAVGLARDGDMVLLAKGLYEGSDFPLRVNRSITLAGVSDDGARLEGGELSGLLELSNASVVLRNLTFTNGFAALGGAVLASNCSVAIQNCKFVNNTAVAALPNSGGGAVYLNNSVAQVTGSDFYNSNATMLGGAIAALFNRPLDARFKPWQLLSISGSRFLLNHLRSPRGAQGTSVGVTFDSVTLNNTVLVLDSNDFLSGMGHGESGDSFGAVGIFYVMNTHNASVFSHMNHFAKNNMSVTQGNCYGGGLSVQYVKLSSNVTVASQGDIFDSNTCLAGQQGNAEGGAFSVMLNQDSTDAVVSVQDAEFTGNVANGHYSGLGGGASVFNNGASTDFVLFEQRNVYRNNSARSGGEGSTLGGGMSVFFNNRAVGASLTFRSSQYFSNSIETESSQEGSCLGGGLSVFFNSQVSGISAEVRNVTAQYNKATEDGNQGKSYGGGVSLFFNENQHDNPGTSIDNSTITLNQAMLCSNVFTTTFCS
jgi:hypothetical protein